MSSLSTSETINKAGESTAMMADKPEVELQSLAQDMTMSLTMNPSDSAAISTFLSKPYLIVQTTWTVAQTIGTSISDFPVTDYLQTVPLWFDKIKSYKYFRGSAVVTVQLNGQPFQCGALILSYLPMEANREGWYSVSRSVAPCLTQLPHIIMRPTDATGVFRAPFIGPVSWYDVTSVSPQLVWGGFSLQVLSQLRSNGASTVGVSVFLHFEDVEVAAPVFIPEGDMVDRSMKKNVSRERRNMAKKGVISGTLEALSSPMKALSFIPGVSTVSSIVDASMPLLEAFGWSRPIEASPNTSVSLNLKRQDFNFNASNASSNLTMDAVNQVAPLSSFAGTEADEMSFAYLKARTAYLTEFLYESSDISGEVLKVLQMSPPTLSAAVTTGINTQRAGCPAVALSRYFRYYRGSFKLTFKIFKTMYHSGRFIVSYNPTFNVVPNVPSSQNLYREIVDLSVSDEVCFTIPYISATPYLVTGWETVSVAPFYDVRSVYGTVTVTALSPLIAPPTVSSQIAIQIYVSAAEDFELAQVTSAPTMMSAEMGDAPVPSMCLDTNIGGMSSMPLTLEPANTCIGEVFTSLKQLVLLLRPLSRAALFTGNAPRTGYCALSFYPFLFGLPKSTAAVGIYTRPLFGLDLLSELAQGFAFSRGGIRYSIPAQSSSYGTTSAFIRNVGPGTQYLLATFPNVVAIGGTVDGAQTNTQFNGMVIKSDLGGMIDVIVPHTSAVPYRLNHTLVGGTSIAAPTTPDVPQVHLDIYSSRNIENDSFETQIYRSGADDFTLGYFIGFPPFTSRYVASP